MVHSVFVEYFSCQSNTDGENNTFSTSSAQPSVTAVTGTGYETLHFL